MAGPEALITPSVLRWDREAVNLQAVRAAHKVNVDEIVEIFYNDIFLVKTVDGAMLVTESAAPGRCAKWPTTAPDASPSSEAVTERAAGVARERECR